jgi:hypothetical protein
MAVFMSRFFRLPAPVDGKPLFQDVPKTHWAFRYIQGLAQTGLTQGCAASTFCPDLPLTRAQMAVFLVRTFNLT